MAWTQLQPQVENESTEGILDQLFEILNRISGTRRYVFRGHASALWPHLVPSIHRALGPDKSLTQRVRIEAAGIRTFRRHARSMLQASELAYFDKILDGLTLMQHYGAPTRLLDWTLSPWVACYFASDSGHDEDGVIWAFNHDKLNTKNHEQSESREFKRFRKLEDSSTVEAWAAAAAEQAGSYISIFRYQYANPQMGAQQSLFTVTGELGENHDEALAKSLPGAEDTLRVMVPRSCKKDLRRRLLQMNVCALSLFPSINGVGLHVTEAIQCNFLSDEGLLLALMDKLR